MLKLINIEKEQFDNFVESHKEKSHFLQSLAWGEFANAKKNATPFYLGLIDDNKNIVAATLLLEKHLPLNYTYFYAPRGFVLNYNDKHILNEMTKQVVKFAKNKKAIFVKIDPDLVKQRTNHLEEITIEENNYFKNIKEAGFKHLGFTKNFETNQPRYTFRIDLTKPWEEIENNFSKTTKQRINKAEKLDIQVSIGTKKDVKDFCELMKLTENRKDFIGYTDDYYETLYEVLNANKKTKAVLFLGKINFNKTIKALENNLKKVKDQISILPIDNLSKSAKMKFQNLTNQKNNLNEQIEKYKDAKKKFGDTLLLSAHMIIKYGNKAWVLYAGNHNELTETYANYLTYKEHIKYLKEKNVEIYDQFGTIGDLSKNNPRIGLHEFKKKFGGDYIEFIGEWDYVINKVMYFAYTKLIPIYRKIIRNKSKKELTNEISKTK